MVTTFLTYKYIRVWKLRGTSGKEFYVQIQVVEVERHCSFSIDTQVAKVQDGEAKGLFIYREGNKDSVMFSSGCTHLEHFFRMIEIFSHSLFFFRKIFAPPSTLNFAEYFKLSLESFLGFILSFYTLTPQSTLN